MSIEAEKLIAAANEGTNKPAVMMSGLGPVLRLVVAWVRSVETRLEKMEGANGAR